jgi:O-glycosyl hydrolase
MRSFVIGVVMLAMTVVLRLGAQGTVVVDWTDVRQRIDGFGASSYANQFPDAVIANADLLFDKDRGVGLSLMRMGLPHNPDTGGRPYKDREIAKLAQARGATVWASNFYPPAIWKDTGLATNGGHLLVARYPDYADLLADEVETLKTVDGVTIYALSIQNEPDNAPPWGSCLFSAAEFKAFVPHVFNELKRRGLPTKIILGEQTSWRFTRVADTMNDPTTAAMIAILAAHPYAKPDGWASPYKGVRPIWQTEHSIGQDDAHGMSTALTQATEIHNFMVQSEIQAWHAWNLGVIMGGKRLYTLGHWSKFVRPGFVRIGTTSTGPVLVSAYKDATDGRFAVVAVNSGSATTVAVQFAGISPTSVTPWVTSATLNMAPQATIDVTGGRFTYAFAANSVVTFVGGRPVAMTPPANLRIIR